MTTVANGASIQPMRRLKIYFDGGSRPNPGRMETAVVARGITYYQADYGCGSNTDAEWLALIHATEIARLIGVRNALFLGDSAVVVGQANGALKCRNALLQSYLVSFNSAKSGFEYTRVKHIGRHQNLAGIALQKRRM